MKLRQTLFENGEVVSFCSTAQGLDAAIKQITKNESFKIIFESITRDHISPNCSFEKVCLSIKNEEI